MTFKKSFTLFLVFAACLLTACQGQNAGNQADSASSESDSAGGESDEFKIAMVTDGNGVDDRSFNQSAWEGMQEWASEQGFSEQAVEYYQSNSENDFLPNLNTAIQDDYEIIYGIGFMLEEAVQQVAEQNPDQKFGVLDTSVEGLDNVVSINFADNESAYLAGVAAASQSQSNKIGFVGGQKSPALDKFQAGYVAGAESVNPDIEIDIQYADSFTDAAVAQQIANAMYTNGVDVIFQAAGGAGNGVITEARNRLESGQNEDIWVIGCDRDQSEEGEWAEGNFILCSTLKELGQAISNESNSAMDGQYHGGELIISDLENGGVGLVKDQLNDEVGQAVDQAEQAILNGEIEVPASPDGE